MSMLSKAARTACTTTTRARLHASAVSRDLVGPPDPISNLRVVVYDDAPPPPSEDGRRHPYSLREFRGDTREYQWKMQREALDAFNMAFWTESNTRFEAAKHACLDALPEHDRERALAEFYQRWLVQETPRQRAYNAELQRRNNANILLGLRVRYQKLMARWGLAPSSSSSSS